MAWTYDNSLGGDVNDAIITKLNGGTMEFVTSGNTVLASLALANPCATKSNKVLTFATISDDTSADADGTIASARFKDSGGTVRISGIGVATSGSNVIVVNTLTVITGKNVSVTSLTFTQP